MKLFVDQSQLDRAVRASRAGLPQEVCGLFLGRTSVQGAVHVVEAVPVRNCSTESREDRFEVHPEDLLRLDGVARERGLEIVGVWHSHPDSVAVPSRTDLEAAWPGWSYLIVGRAAHADVHVRSWRLVGEVFEEEELRALENCAEEHCAQKHSAQEHCVQEHCAQEDSAAPERAAIAS